MVPESTNNTSSKDVISLPLDTSELKGSVLVIEEESVKKPCTESDSSNQPVSGTKFDV